jgi:hypothetical protein
MYKGYDEFGEKSNDIYQYSFELNEWKKIVPTSGVVPGIFGGISTLICSYASS